MFYIIYQCLYFLMYFGGQSSITSLFTHWCILHSNLTLFTICTAIDSNGIRFRHVGSHSLSLLGLFKSLLILTPTRITLLMSFYIFLLCLHGNLKTLVDLGNGDSKDVEWFSCWYLVTVFISWITLLLWRIRIISLLFN